MKIGITIKRFRILKGYNQSTLSRICGITQAYLSVIEQDKKTPSMDVLESISKALDLPTPFLFFYSIDEDDVHESRKSMYKILHPHMRKMIDDIVFNCF